jgi:hypothetical protein
MITFAAATKYTTTTHPYALDCSTAVNTTIAIMAAIASNASTTNALVGNSPVIGHGKKRYLL